MLIKCLYLFSCLKQLYHVIKHHRSFSAQAQQERESGCMWAASTILGFFYTLWLPLRANLLIYTQHFSHRTSDENCMLEGQHAIFLGVIRQYGQQLFLISLLYSMMLQAISHCCIVSQPRERRRKLVFTHPYQYPCSLGRSQYELCPRYSKKFYGS